MTSQANRRSSALQRSLKSAGIALLVIAWCAAVLTGLVIVLLRLSIWLATLIERLSSVDAFWLGVFLALTLFVVIYGGIQLVTAFWEAREK